jgi:endoglucanase
VPKLGIDAYTWANNVLRAGIPLVLTETGDHNAPGTVGAPFVSKVLPWADHVGASYVGWAWDVWHHQDNVLIKDKQGTPTDGYGAYFKQHLLCLDDPIARCH